jgi:hypothetical protein
MPLANLMMTIEKKRPKKIIHFCATTSTCTFYLFDFPKMTLFNI